MEDPVVQDGPTLAGFLDSILPQDWTWTKLFEWPPDVFFLTSSILKITGAYRHAVLPPNGTWPAIHDWGRDVPNAAYAWRVWMVVPDAPVPPFLAERIKDLGKLLETPILLMGCLDHKDESPTSSESAENSDPAWKLCQVVMELHALADEACHGFGLPSGFFARAFGNFRPEMNAIDFQANMLLAMTGTLSRLSRAHGVVLPKMRTPQVGMTLRSLSHQVTYHQTEVQVVWRTLPWVNIDEDTINILVVSWPVEMKAAWFRPVAHFVRRNSTEPARYFTFTGEPTQNLTKRILDLVEKAKRLAHRIHMIVFPELSLTSSEFNEIKNLLARRLRRDSIPLLVAGLRDEPDAPAQHSSVRSGSNRIVLSTFFGGKWYDLHQNKHHRWRLEESQIKQYLLGGVLGAKQNWWEAIDIPQRRLMFLAPNGWLTLCPLICEDLARQEPVSDLIRGVGPTLLVAILLDGPQLPARWPGRYANVLADDPGTSVLTVSSLGMVNLAVPKNQPDKEGFVALWKDQLTNWTQIKLEEGQEAALVTLAASWYEEFTADGRGDGTAAAVFSLQGYKGLDVAIPEPRAEQEEPTRKDAPAEVGESANQQRESPGEEEERNYISGNESDVSELTTFSFLADAALDVPNHLVDNFAAWAKGMVAEEDWLETTFRGGKSVFDCFRSRAKVCDEEFLRFVDQLAEFLKSVPLAPSPDAKDKPTQYWTRLVDATQAVLEEAKADRYEGVSSADPQLGSETGRVPPAEALRAEIYTALAVLWAVHRRLARHRQESGLTFASTHLMERVEVLLRERYDDEWYRALSNPGSAA